MRRKKFPLNGIAKIREYREELARRKFVEAKKPIDDIDQKILVAETVKQKGYQLWNDAKAKEAEQTLSETYLLQLHTHILNCIQEQQKLREERIVLEGKIETEKEGYLEARKEKKAIGILEKKFIAQEKEARKKDQQQIFEERVTCSDDS